MSEQYRKVCCAKCGRVNDTQRWKPCPVCGGYQWNVDIDISEKIYLEDFIEDATGVNRNGQISMERIQRQDGQTTATLSADVGKSADVLVKRFKCFPKRDEKFAEESIAAAALKDAINRFRGTQYTVGHKKQEDYEYADRILVSRKDEPARIDVQIRHLDRAMIKSLGENKKFSGLRSIVEVTSYIRQSIDEKAKVDVGIKGKTILLLITPAPLGKLMTQDLQREQFDRGGFREVWIAPFREGAFSLICGDFYESR